MGKMARHRHAGKSMGRKRPIHPGEVLREEFLAPRDLTIRALSVALQMSTPDLAEVVGERRKVTPDIAQRLANYFDTSPQFWLSLQASYDLKTAQRETKSGVAGS